MQTIATVSSRDNVFRGFSRSAAGFTGQTGWTTATSEKTQTTHTPSDRVDAFGPRIPRERLERSGSRVELRTLDYENPGSNPGCGVRILGKFFHSTLLQFTHLNK